MGFDLGALDQGRYGGVLVVPDVHAHPRALERAAARGRTEGLYLVQLGDLVDRGPASAEAVAVMRTIVEAGEGTFLVGNHEDKLVRCAREGVAETPWRLATLGQLVAAPDGLLDWFFTAIDRAPLFARAPRVVLAHAAYHPAMAADAPLPPRARHRALYGVTEHVADRERPVRSRAWVDDVPAGIDVFVGHDVLSVVAPVCVRGAGGGAAWFLDTAGWRGGAWTTRALTWDDLG